MSKSINIKSEIGKLKSVILKRPGKEIENITPETMPRLLFDDIPYLPIAQKEHDEFAQVLKTNGVEVLYLDDLVSESITTSEVKREFLNRMIAESGFKEESETANTLFEYLNNMGNLEMVTHIMEGVRKDEVELSSLDLKEASGDKAYPFLMDPMPNLYFTRDPAAAIGNGLSINKMTYKARQRESLFMEYIISNHPKFANQGVQVWRNRNHFNHIEGGDELVLNDHVLAIGISQRTTAEAIEDIAKSLFTKNSGYDTVLAIKIPHNHAMMHLDTVFTMINYDQFTVHPAILNQNQQIDIWIMHPKGQGVSVKHERNLKEVLKVALKLDDLDLIPTGNGDPIVAPREQWNDGSNTLAIAPGEVVTYDRNYVSNDILRKHGLHVHEIQSSELSRGRGGPRCMSMPIYREDLKK